MKIKKIKEKVLTAWEKQLAKYEAGPVVGESYCVRHHCYLCGEFAVDFAASAEYCRLCPHGINEGCINQSTFMRLSDSVTRNPVIHVTPELTAAMALRHRFYVEGLKILEPLPESRFESGEGFPELVALDKELYEEFVDDK